MGERRVLSKYLPPDYDPSKVKRLSKPYKKQNNIRFMFPFTIKCSNCGEIMMQGTKGNARKELCDNEDYLGIKIYRLYMHCKACYSEIIIKTDPKNMDYLIEKGGIRETYFEPWVEFENKEKEREQRETDENKIEKQIKKDVLQSFELEELQKQRMHLRRPKLSDLNKIYNKRELIDHSLTLNDRNKIRQFDITKNKQNDKNKKKQKDSIKLQQIESTNFFANNDEEY